MLKRGEIGCPQSVQELPRLAHPPRLRAEKPRARTTRLGAAASDPAVVACFQLGIYYMIPASEHFGNGEHGLGRLPIEESRLQVNNRFRFNLTLHKKKNRKKKETACTM